MEYNYDSTLQSSNTDIAVSAAVFASIVFFVAVFTLIAYIINGWLLSRVFKKASVPQWIAWVPLYNTWKTLEIGGQKGFWAVVALIPFVNIIAIIFLYIALFHIGKKLGKEDWFVALAIVVPLIWLIWLAFDDSKWQESKPVNESPSVKPS